MAHTIGTYNVIHIGSKMSKDTKYLQLRGNTYWARVSVPRTLTHVLGKHLRASLKTGSLEEANRRKLEIVAHLKNQIAEARLSGAPNDSKEIIDWKFWRKELQELRTQDHLVSSKDEWTNDTSSSKNRIRNNIEAVEDFVLKRVSRLSKKIGEDSAREIYKKITEPKKLLSELITDYLNSDGLSIDKYRKAQIALRDLSNHFKDDIPPHKINPYEMLSFIDKLSASNLSPNTLRDRRNSLSLFWKWLEKRLYATKGSNPFTSDDFEIKGGTTESSRAFKESEIKAILKADFIHEWRRDVFLVLMYTGARPTEICSLRMKDINLEDQTFSIKDSKTKAGNRELPYNHSVLVSIFKRYYSGDPDKRDQLLFPMVESKSERQGKPYINFFSRLKDDLKLPADVTLYSAKKSFITTCLDLEMNDINIQRYVGHKIKGDALIHHEYMLGRGNKGLVAIAEKFHYPFKVE